VGNHLFVIFAVLDVSCTVNSCINHSFFTLITYNSHNKLLSNILEKLIVNHYLNYKYMYSTEISLDHVVILCSIFQYFCLTIDDQ